MFYHGHHPVYTPVRPQESCAVYKETNPLAFGLFPHQSLYDQTLDFTSDCGQAALLDMPRLAIINSKVEVPTADELSRSVFSSPHGVRLEHYKQMVAAEDGDFKNLKQQAQIRPLATQVALESRWKKVQAAVPILALCTQLRESFQKPYTYRQILNIANMSSQNYLNPGYTLLSIYQIIFQDKLNFLLVNKCGFYAQGKALNLIKASYASEPGVDFVRQQYHVGYSLIMNTLNDRELSLPEDVKNPLKKNPLLTIRIEVLLPLIASRAPICESVTFTAYHPELIEPLIRLKDLITRGEVVERHRAALEAAGKNIPVV